LWFSDRDDLDAFDEPAQTYDDRAVLQYSIPRRTGREARRFRSAAPAFRSRSMAAQQRARSWLFCRRSGERGEHQQRSARHKEERSAFHSRDQQQQHRHRDSMRHEHSGKQSYVSFYFTNVPVDISYISLRRGFEVCGMMEDVYLAKKRNMNRGVFGFVRYGNVRDVDKLLKALNNVWFGDFRVVAKVASFDRFGNRRHAGGVEGAAVIRKDLVVHREVTNRTAVRGVHLPGVNFKENGSIQGVAVNGRGNVVSEEGERILWKEGTVADAQLGRKPHVLEDKKNLVYIPKYTSSVSNVSWASKGLVVSVLNGEAIPLLQRRIYDAGFVNLVIIPFGADKVFLRSLDDVDVSSTLSAASDFFNKFFSPPVRWTKDTTVRERGAWVRIFGVPLHAWNFDFFKLCVYDCGRLLKVDDITLDRDRFDYARVLVLTSSLNLINSEASILVDGALFQFRIMEEWGVTIGEDACIVDDTVSQADDRSVLPEDSDDGVGGGAVDELLNRLSEDWKKEDELLHFVPHPVSDTVKFNSAPPIPVAPTQAEDPPLELVNDPEPVQDSVSKGYRKDQNLLFNDKKRVKRTASCPPGRDRATSSGPWSLEWVNSRKYASSGEATKPITKASVGTSGGHRATKKKGGGYLRHSALNLRRIARLSDTDRRAVLRALRRTTKPRKAGSRSSKAKDTSKVASTTSHSQTSVNNDWNNWLVLHGNDKVLAEDVCAIGRTVGLKFSGDLNNKFDVLSGKGRKYREGGGDGV